MSRIIVAAINEEPILTDNISLFVVTLQTFQIISFTLQNQ